MAQILVTVLALGTAWADPMDVVRLNRHLFTANVLNPAGRGAEQWVVSFCPHWWRPCQTFASRFAKNAKQWHSELNTDSSFVRVRFAEVDCAAEKALCNEQGVKTYPRVAVYRGGEQVEQTGGLKWSSQENHLETWLEEQLSPMQASSFAGSVQLPLGLSQYWQLSSEGLGEGPWLDLLLTVAAVTASTQLVRTDKASGPRVPLFGQTGRLPAHLDL
mmetsp:Transcript_19084/g.45253  ORF Transcript_19084/g.45253 Transcript_19084/m.45253 type:complete len:217 (-) Transcript_19084:89-739(-)